jgi:hypothetical protein
MKVCYGRGALSYHLLKGIVRVTLKTKRTVFYLFVLYSLKLFLKR